MPDLSARLSGCFELVFPDLPVAEIPEATQANVKKWDSVAAITLVNVIEEQFEVQMDYDRLPDLDGFAKILAYLRDDLRAAP